mmetsp:Transcript_18164/g.26878  ORF Transcript_18164/g.26878 Transcript_18164/m.26878 type:complete len:451 (+) Transcript_18164:142-1494(+)|eukprot:CAMPEP_0194222006 /NCGR_PEP_ID=MMETSP0156-20130528/31890_1 /TAXON_ID=33649 /ORGANISM="Thalassionema nitzschioides, Strain L26-B" /LENGTH=450 /DNA_ID=CAMNT_0038952619 /DNA_START=88 /DNA_END=1440 /DNA_ORIENTATION=+
MSNNKLDIQQEILLNFDKCHELLQRFQTSNTTKEDLLALTQNGVFVLHEVLLRCQGDGILPLVEYLVDILDPNKDSAPLTDSEGNVPIHILPQGFAPPATKLCIQKDQLPARRFLLQQYPESLTKTNHNGETPLIRAIHVDYNIFVESYITEFPEELLLREKEMSDKSNGDVTPYHHPLQCAMDCGNAEAVKLILTNYPESINMVPLHEYPCSGDLAERQTILASVAEALPDTFDIFCQCNNNNEEEECHCGLSKNLVQQFFLESKLSAWGQDVMWRLMKSSYHRRQQQLTDHANLESELIRSLRSEKEQLECAFMESRESLVQARQELIESNKSLQKTKKEVEQHQKIAQKQEAKFVDVSTKIRSLLETRKFNCESKVGVSNIDKEWPVANLKAVLESLIERLDSLLPTDDAKPSVAHIAALYLVKDNEPSKDYLTDVIEALQKELAEL